MHSPGIRERAVALYDSGLSARAVTKKLKEDLGTYVSPQTIARWMRQVGRSRPVGRQRYVNLPTRAKQLYSSGMNIAKVAERFHAGKTVAAKRLREMGMEIRPSGSLFGHRLTADRLREMYRQKGMRAQEIAKATGCNAGTVYNWLKKWDIPLKRVRRRGLRVQRND